MKKLRKKFNIVPLKDNDLRKSVQAKILSVEGVAVAEIGKRWIRLEYDEKTDTKKIAELIEEAGIEQRTSFLDSFL